MTNPILLDIPFNETTGTTAADYSVQQVPAVLSDGVFVPGRTGRAAYFVAGGQAEVHVDDNTFSEIVPLAGTYSFCCWLRAEQTGDGPGATWLLYKFAGLRQYLYLNLYNDCTSWVYLVIQQDTDRISVYVNGNRVSSEPIPAGWGTPTGFAVVNDNGHDTAGYCTVQNLRIYDGLIPLSLTIPDRLTMDLNYYINGQNFKGFGVYVSDSDGLIDNLGAKEFFKTEWDDYHGEVIDLNRPRYRPREITLSCFIYAQGKDEFQDRVKQFLAQFIQPGTQRLLLEAHTTKPLVYEVYCAESVNLKKKWSDGAMVGTFELKLREPQPVKRVLKFGAGTATITLTTAKLVTIYWGDGQLTRDVSGTAVTVTHTYGASSDPLHYIIIAGVIEDITGFSSNAPVVWNKL